MFFDKSTTMRTLFSAGDGEAKPTAAASGTTNEIDGKTDENSSKTPKVGQEANGGDDGDNTLWEQMTAREGRDAARRAGMSVGDWQAERQLQEALRESVQVSPQLQPQLQADWLPVNKPESFCCPS